MDNYQNGVNKPLFTWKRYNPDAIARYYNQRPWLVIGRIIQVIWYFLGFVINLLGDKLFNQEEQNKWQRATQIREILTNLGPTYIKVGQALSTRPDLIRKDFLEELIKLQDQLPPFPQSIAFDIIETELDKHITDIFQEISPNPVAAASLGQVYRAKLYTGEEVAVKVQRPNLLPVLTLDLYLMRGLASSFGKFLPLNLGHDLTLIVDEFGTKLFEEVDYQNEGKNAEKFATNFRDDPTVKVPSIYWDYSSKHVLTLEWINGCKLTDAEQIKKSGYTSDNIVKIGVTSGLKQLLEHGFFHADPHPGNLFALPDGRMGYIDFGMMDQLEEETKETLVSSVVHLINEDYYELAQDFVKLGFLTADTDITPIIPALEAVFKDAIGAKVGDFNFKTITDKFSDLMYQYPFRVPAKFALIIRSLVTQEGLALSINSDFKIVAIAYPYISQRLLTGESPELRRRLLEVLFKNGQFQWQRLENMIGIARSDGNFDLLPTAQLGLQYLLSDEGKFLRQQLLQALIADDRLHTKEVERLWNLVKEDMPPQRIFNVAWSAFTEFSSEKVAAILPSVPQLTLLNTGNNVK